MFPLGNFFAGLAITLPHDELMVTILAGLATFERRLIKARTEDGRKRPRTAACGSVARPS
jgi:DNA invertase Pin-like site-specific DNA recombinase